MVVRERKKKALCLQLCIRPFGGFALQKSPSGPCTVLGITEAQFPVSQGLQRLNTCSVFQALHFNSLQLLVSRGQP
ncbi:hypothetical protein BDW67DRAFT_155967 [Aspergillus spinulosporus]